MQIIYGLSMNYWSSFSRRARNPSSAAGSGELKTVSSPERRANEFQSRGVKKGPIQRRNIPAARRSFARRAVERIAHHGMAEGARWTRIWWVRPVSGMASSSVKCGKRSHNAIARQGLARRNAAGLHAHAFGRDRDPRLRNLARILGHAAVHQRQIGLVNFARLELRRKGAMRGIVLRHDHQPGGHLVEPVDDAGPQISARRRKFAHMVQQRVDQRAALHPAPTCTTIPAGLSTTNRSSSS